MLAKSKRLTTSEVERVMSKGQGLISGSFLVKFIENPNSSFKISPLPPKKTFSTAVLRNKVKRRISACIQELIKDKKNIRNGFLIAIIPNKKAISEKIPNLTTELEQVFEKGGIL